MGAIWDVLRKHPVNPNLPPPDPYPPGEVLGEADIRFLMDLYDPSPLFTARSSHHVVRFDKHYVPWLNIASIRMNPGAALNLQNILVLACCAIACRHLPGGGPPGAQRGLQQLAEHAVLIRTFDAAAHASLEGVQALLILSMWSPAIGPASTSVHDGSLIASGAVRMALVLKLDQVSERAIALRTKAQDQGGFQEGEKKLYDDLMWKARLVSTYLERTRTRADGAVVAGGLQRRVEVSPNACVCEINNG
jgi:hypothetical protein